MPIIRKKHHTENFVVLDKHFLEDKTISFKAKGLLTLLISRPDAWKVSARELAATGVDGKDSVYAGLKELQEAGYIQYTEVKTLEGKFQDGEYCVYECKPPMNGLNDSSKPHLAKPYRENPTLVNNELVNNKLKTKQELKIVELQTVEAEPCSVRFCSIDGEMTVASGQPEQLHHGDEKIIASSCALQEPVVRTISEKLTADQEAMLTTAISKWKCKVVITNPSALFDEVKFSLLNPRHFFQAGNDFNKKLNTISKMVCERRWKTPFGFGAQVSNESPFTDRSQSRKIRELEIELNSHRQSLVGPLGKNPQFRDSQLQVISSLELQISALQASSTQPIQSLFFNQQTALSTQQEEIYDRYQKRA